MKKITDFAEPTVEFDELEDPRKYAGFIGWIPKYADLKLNEPNT